jgi:Ca2+-transporting ATPase
MKSIFEIPVLNNRKLVLAVLCSLVMLLAVVYIPVLQVIFKTVVLSMDEWIIVGGLSFIGPVIASFFKFGKR